MNSNQSAQQDLAHIRKIMDSQARLLAFSGYSTVGIGVFWLGALLFLARNLDERLSRAPQNLGYVLDYLRPELMGLAGLFVLCLAVAFIFTLREARMKFETLYGKGGFNVGMGVAFFLAVGFVFCLSLLSVSALLTVAAILLLYGLLIMHVGKYSRHDILPLGLGCVVLGLFCAWTGKAWLSLLLGFGVLHLVYGLWVELRKRR